MSSVFFTPPRSYRESRCNEGSKSVIGKIYNNENFKAIKALEEESLRKKESFQSQILRSRKAHLRSSKPSPNVSTNKIGSPNPSKTLFYAEKVHVIECPPQSSSSSPVAAKSNQRQMNAPINFNNNQVINPSSSTDTPNPKRNLRKAFNDPYYRRPRTRLGSQKIEQSVPAKQPASSILPTPQPMTMPMGLRYMKEILAIQYNICRGCCTEVQPDQEKWRGAGGVWHKRCLRCKVCRKILSASDMCEARDQIYCSSCNQS